MEFFHPLGVVVPPIQGWHVRVKVLRAFRVWLDPPAKRLGYVFADEQGVKIEGFVDRSMANYYDDFIQQGQWYTITTFGLYNNLDEFRATKHHFKMYFLQGTVVQPTPAVDALIPNNFADFREIMDDTIDATYLIDMHPLRDLSSSLGNKIQNSQFCVEIYGIISSYSSGESVEIRLVFTC